MWFFHSTDGSRDSERVRDRLRQKPREVRSALPPTVDVKVGFVHDDSPVSREVVDLSSGRDRLHRGRRSDRRHDDKLSRQERQDGVLHTLGMFRVASRRSIADACFDGHPFAANRVMKSLIANGAVVARTVKKGKHGYQVYSLTGAGRDQLAINQRLLEQDQSSAGEQRFCAVGGDARQLRHDHHIFDAVRKDVAPVLNAGGKIVRVRLESELRGRLAAAEAMGRKAAGEPGAREARRKEAVTLGLRVFVRGVPLPDAVVELEEPDGRRVVRSIEVASGHYTSVQIAEKRDAGFRVYGIPGFRSGGGRKGRGTLRGEETFPLSWGGGR